MILAILKLLKNGGMTLQLDPMDQPSCDAIHDGMDVFSAEQDDTVGISFKRGHKNKNGGGAKMRLDSADQPSMDVVNKGRSFISEEQSNSDTTCLGEGTIKMQERE